MTYPKLSPSFTWNIFLFKLENSLHCVNSPNSSESVPYVGQLTKSSYEITEI